MPFAQLDGQIRPAWTRDLTIRINADAAAVFALLRDVERWPLIFDHINAVRVVRQVGTRRLIVVRASWYGLPVGWRAIQTVEPELGRMTLHHVSPLTSGSIAVWDVRPVMDSLTIASQSGAPATDLVVHSQVQVPLPVIGPLLARHFVGGRVGRQFGQAMAARIKLLAEATAACPSAP